MRTVRHKDDRGGGAAATTAANPKSAGIGPRFTNESEGDGGGGGGGGGAVAFHGPGLASTSLSTAPTSGARTAWTPSIPPPLDALIALDDLLRVGRSPASIFPKLVEILRAVSPFRIVGLGYDDVGACASTTLSACGDRGGALRQRHPSSVSAAESERDSVHAILAAARQYFESRTSFDAYLAQIDASEHLWICLPITTDEGVMRGVLAVAHGDDSIGEGDDDDPDSSDRLVLDREQTVSFIAIVARQLARLLANEIAAKEVTRRAMAFSEQTIELDEERRLRSAAQSEAAGALAAVVERDELLSTVSHDLKNPLSVILMSTSSLLRGGRVSSQVQAIDRNARRMRRLVDDLLDMGSIEAGSLSMVPRPCHPRQLLDDAMIDALPLAVVKGVNLSVDYKDTDPIGRPIASLPLPPPPPLVWADADRIVQVLTNIVANAIKFTPTGGRVVLRGRRDSAEMFSFAVSDTGRGIAADHLPRIFDRYWQADPSSRAGSGLGLSICRSLVQLSGGEIAATSVVSEGTTIVFTLPIANLQTAQ